MELKSIFQMTKTDRYTQDGRDQIAKLQETEDVKYKTGDISQKTGLQKQPDGSWAPPKKGGAGRKMTKAEKTERANKGISIEQIGEGKSFKNENGAKIDITGTGTDGSIQFMVTTSEGTKQSHHARSKEEMERILSVNGYEAAESKPGRDTPLLKNKDHVDLAKEVKSNTMPGSDWTAEEIAKEWKLGKADAEEVKKEFDKIKESKPATEPKHTLEVGSEVKFKKSGQPITIKKIENYGGTPIVVGEYDNNGKRETNRFRLDELDYEQKEERKDLVSGNTLEEGRTVNFKKTGQPIKIKKVEYYGSTPIIVGEYEHNGKTETNRFRMDEISTDAAPRITADTKIKLAADKVYQIGEISEKTGLQKTANGWRPVKKGADQKWMEKTEKKTAKEIMSKAGPGRTFELKMGENGQPTLGKEVKTYRTKKEAQEALNKQKAAESKKGQTLNTFRTGNSDYKWDVTIKGGENSLANEFFEQHGARFNYHGKDVNLDDYVKPIDNNSFELKVFNAGNQSRGYYGQLAGKGNNTDIRYIVRKTPKGWDVLEKQRQYYGLPERREIYKLDNNKYSKAQDAAPRELTGDTKIRIRK